MLLGPRGAEQHYEFGAQRGRRVEVAQVQKLELVETGGVGEVVEERGEEGRWVGREVWDQGCLLGDGGWSVLEVPR